MLASAAQTHFILAGNTNSSKFITPEVGYGISRATVTAAIRAAQFLLGRGGETAARRRYKRP
jgi:hypothetical protein